MQFLFADCVWQNRLGLFVCCLEQAVIDRKQWTSLGESVRTTWRAEKQKLEVKSLPGLGSHVVSERVHCCSWTQLEALQNVKVPGISFAASHPWLSTSLALESEQNEWV